MTLPPYSQPQGAAYDVPSLLPPFFIQRQTAHVFPLRANMQALQNFIDGYANIVPPELGRFRACAPYVHLMMVDYGSLGAKSSNIGRLSQYETIFTVPVAWYRVLHGRWVFADWAWLTPFILVDSELSLVLGRTMPGWHKGLARWLPTSSAAWMRNPRSETPVATVETMVFERPYHGEAQCWRPFLEVLRRPPPSPFGLLTDTNNPFAPWEAMRNTMAAVQGFSRDYFGMLDGLGIMPLHLVTGQQNYMRMATRVAASLGPQRPDVSFNTINLKQFRDVGSASEYCYQALTNWAFRIAAIESGGPLFDASTFAGDTSGGYTLRLHRWATLPIIETLGLEVTRQSRGEGVDVAELEPVLPFWYTVDMTYEQGNDIAWRGADRVWRDKAGLTYPPKGGVDDRGHAAYNTMLGLYLREFPGPHAFSSSLRVLPLLAAKSAVQSFLDSHYNSAMNIDTSTPLGVRFDVWGPPSPIDECMYVYLVVRSHGTVTSPNQDLGRWLEEDLSFLVPVLLRERVGDTWQLRGAGVVPVFSYTDNATAAVTLSETQGIPTVAANFVHPPSSWLTRESSIQKLIEVSTEVLPVLNLGAWAIDAVIVEIFAGKGLEVSAEVAALRSREMERKTRVAQEQGEQFDEALSLGGRLLAGEVPLHTYTLKQFRDSVEPSQACYQSIVRIPETIESLGNVHEIKHPMRVRIHEYASQPIVNVLGLVGTRAREQDGGAVHEMTPIRPFALDLSRRQELGENLWVRSGTEAWSRSGHVWGATSDALAAIDPQTIIEVLLSSAAREPTRS